MTRLAAGLLVISLVSACGDAERPPESTTADTAPAGTTAPADSIDPFRDAVADTQYVTDSLGNELMIVTERAPGGGREVRPRKGAGDPAEPDAIELVTPSDARAAMSEASVRWYVLDVRSAREYVDRGHLPDATLVAVDRLEENVDDLHVRVGQPILVVSEEDLDSRRAARILVEYGFPDVRVLRGGLQAWREAGFPLESR